MREGTIGTILDPFSVVVDILIASRTVLQRIERTIAEQTVDLVGMLMAGIILAVFVFEKFKGRFHKHSWEGENVWVTFI